MTAMATTSVIKRSPILMACFPFGIVGYYGVFKARAPIADYSCEGRSA